QRLQGEGLHRQGRRDLGPGEGGGHQGAGGQSVMMERVLRSLVRYAPLLILAIGWELVSRLGLVSSDALPPLSAVVTAWIGLLHDGDLVTNGGASLWRGGAGLALAIVIGGALGILMARWRTVNIIFGPLVEMFYPVPKSALIPVTVIWLGLG